MCLAMGIADAMLPTGPPFWPLRSRQQHLRHPQQQGLWRLLPAAGTRQAQRDRGATRQGRLGTDVHGYRAVQRHRSSARCDVCVMHTTQSCCVLLPHPSNAIIPSTQATHEHSQSTPDSHGVVQSPRVASILPSTCVDMFSMCRLLLHAPVHDILRFPFASARTARLNNFKFLIAMCCKQRWGSHGGTEAMAAHVHGLGAFSVRAGWERHTADSRARQKPR